MTLDTFLTKLSRTRGWFFGDNNLEIRHKAYPSTRDRGNHCPLSYLAKTAPCSLDAPTTVLKLNPLLAREIANAADNVARTPAERVMRRKLLKACHLG